jgi:hypothetical protein
MMIFKTALPRRAILRGAGTTLALPLLDAMVPALSATARTAAAPVRRLGFIYIPNGVIQNQWTPATEGRDFELPPSLQPLAPVREHVLVLSGLAHREADSKGDGNGDHNRASAVWLSGVHAWNRLRNGSEARLATTADQIAAATLGKSTLLSSLELSLENPTQMACDSADCFFASTISWRTPTTPNTMEAHPRVVFERLFGDGGTAEQRRARAQRTGSILDSVTRELADLQRALGPRDVSKLSEYLDAVRDVEKRIQIAETHSTEADLALPERPVDIPASFDEYAHLMLDLQVLAYRADVTRVFSMLTGLESTNRSYPSIGVPEGHHGVSHHRYDPELVAKKAKIDAYHVTLFRDFLERLRAVPEGDGTLLDHSMILYGGGLGDGNAHDHLNLPTLIGGGRAALNGGRHVKYPDNTPMANLLLTLLDKAGVPTPERIGDSTEHLALG